MRVPTNFRVPDTIALKNIHNNTRKKKRKKTEEKIEQTEPLRQP